MTTEGRVVHCKKEPFDVYIGRPTKWGNPFVIGRDGTRAEVIEKFRAYAKSNKEIFADLDELYDKTLGCYCAPQPCHGDVLLEMIEESFE